MTTARIHTTATTPASVGVNQPVRMPPRRMIGIISGSDASLKAYATSRKAARGRRMPAGPEKNKKKKTKRTNTNKEPGPPPRHEKAGDGDVADRAVDYGRDAGRHQRRDRRR